MQIIENLIPKGWQEELLGLMTEINWTYRPSTVNVYDTIVEGWDICTDENTIDTVQYSHVALNSNTNQSTVMNFFPLIYMIQDRLQKKIKAVNRIKVNCLNPKPNFGVNNYNLPHIDSRNNNFTSVIYYINDSDGDTFVFDQIENQNNLVKSLTLKHRVTPVMGNALVIPSTQFHASSNPTNTQARFVLNFMMELEK
jgi:hypothetical protein